MFTAIYLIGAASFAVLACIGAGAYAAHYVASNRYIDSFDLSMGSFGALFGIAAGMWLWPALAPVAVGYLGYDWYHKRSVNK